MTRVLSLSTLAAGLVVSFGVAVIACIGDSNDSLLGGPNGQGPGGTGPGGMAVSPGGGSGGVGGGGGGAGGGGLMDASVAPPTPQDLFNALEPALVTACGTCHGTTSYSAMAPKWLLGPNRYKTVTTFPGIVVPLSNLGSSLLLTVGDTVTHAGGPGLEGSLRTNVTNWLAAEAEALVTAPLPTTATFTVKGGTNTVDLSKAGVKGASLTFDAVMGGSIITFNNMMVSAPMTTGMEIIHPIFTIVPAGADAAAPTPDVSDSFSNMDEVVPAAMSMPWGVGTFILDVTATIGSSWSSTDKLEIQFTSFKSMTAGDGGTAEGGGGGCKAVNVFTANAVPAIQMNTCLNCHQGENAAATAQLDLTQLGTNNTAACAQALTQVNLKNASQSNIILAPTGGIAAHPFKGASSAFKTMMLTWISAE
jgi:hypothetical protein